MTDFKRLSQSEKSKLFLKYTNDLIPTPCPPDTVCLPPMLGRHVYVDITAIGTFKITDTSGLGYCCTLEVEDILAISPGPLTAIKKIEENMLIDPKLLKERMGKRLKSFQQRGASDNDGGVPE